MTRLKAKALATRATLAAAHPLLAAHARLPTGRARDEGGLELNPDYLNAPEVTIILRMGRHGFDEPRVAEGDLVVADRRVKPDDGSLVVAVMRGKTDVLRYAISDGLELLFTPEGSCKRAGVAEILATVVSVIPVTPEL
jgi:SOS-response transcriptional repressor LexA